MYATRSAMLRRIMILLLSTIFSVTSRLTSLKYMLNSRRRQKPLTGTPPEPA